jgi:hypothetical protein
MAGTSRGRVEDGTTETEPPQTSLRPDIEASLLLVSNVETEIIKVRTHCRDVEVVFFEELHQIIRRLLLLWRQLVVVAAEGRSSLLAGTEGRVLFMSKLAS